MAQRARPSQGKGRGGTRKPVTIDLEADGAGGATAARDGGTPAEPVAMERTTGPSAVGGGGRAAAGGASTRDGAGGNDARPLGDEEAGAGRRGAMGSILAGPVLGGIAGAAVALSAAAGLQWSGLLPAPGSRAEQVDLTPIERDIAAIEARIAALDARQAAAPAEAGFAAEMRARIDTAVQAAQGARAETGATVAAVERVAADLAALQASVRAGEAGEAPALSALTERLDALEGRIGESADAGEALVALETLRGDVEAVRGETGAATGETALLREAVTMVRTRLDEELASLSERLAAAEATLADGGVDTAAVARAVAAAGLKSAIDRGSAFAAELEAFASVAGQEGAVAALRDHAASGVPTAAQLADAFGAVANRIVAAGQGLDQGASIGDRLMASARGLVQVRPVGEVEGDTPGAVAARIEARLKEADLDAALAEWETLPDAARAASSAFMDQVRARRTVDALIADALSSAMSAARPAGRD